MAVIPNVDQRVVFKNIRLFVSAGLLSVVNKVPYAKETSKQVIYKDTHENRIWDLFTIAAGFYHLAVADQREAFDELFGFLNTRVVCEGENNIFGPLQCIINEEEIYYYIKMHSRKPCITLIFSPNDKSNRVEYKYADKDNLYTLVPIQES